MYSSHTCAIATYFSKQREVIIYTCIPHGGEYPAAKAAPAVIEAKISSHMQRTIIFHSIGNYITKCSVPVLSRKGQQPMCCIYNVL